MVSPPEGSRNTGQDPIFHFDGDGGVWNTSSTTIATEGSRKRIRADNGDAESGPVTRLVASQFSTVNAKLDTALKKMANQQIEIDHLRKKLDEAHEHNREQWNQFAAKWASMEKMLGCLGNDMVVGIQMA
jgi:flagellar capping protein FliD